MPAAALVTLTGVVRDLAVALTGRLWSADALLDQQVGGQLAWGIGEIPVLLLAIGVAMSWRAAEERIAERTDRQADRDHDAELERYNAMVAGFRDPPK